MNAIQMLREDHRRIRDLFREYEFLSEGSAKKRSKICDKVFSELEVHTSLEEELFYPAFKEEADADGQMLVEESIEDHRAINVLIEELRALEVDDAEYDGKFQELIESVENHMEQEEDDMFPEAEYLLADTLDLLGRKMEDHRDVFTHE